MPIGDNIVFNNAQLQRPEGSESLSQADDQLRLIKQLVYGLLKKETLFDNFANEISPIASAACLQGYMRAGSSKLYTGFTMPQTRPDGTAFTLEDVGRQWYKTEYRVPTNPIGSSIQEVGDGRFGMYTLLAKTVSGISTYYWVPAQGNAPRGTVQMWVAGLNSYSHSASDPYFSGTMPGWVPANGQTYVVPNGAGSTINFQANFVDSFMEFGGGDIRNNGHTGTMLAVTDIAAALYTGAPPADAAFITGFNDNERSLAAGQVPPHDHQVNATNLKLMTSVNGNHGGHTDQNSGAINTSFHDTNFAQHGNTQGDHQHTVINQNDGALGKTEAVKGDGTAFDASLIMFRPQRIIMLPLVRVY